MKEQLVAKGIEILHILFEQQSSTGMSVNEIFRTTGSKDKPLVIECIKYLERSKLMKTDERVHYKQKRIKILTDLGHTFAELTHCVNKYNKSFEKLKQAVKQNFDLRKDIDKNILLDTLHSRKWKTGEAMKYKKLYDEAHILLSHLSPRENLDILLIRYVSLLSQNNVVDNENAKIILNKIVMDLLSNQVRMIQKNRAETTNSDDNDDTDKDEQPFDHVATEKFGVLDYIFDDGKDLQIRFINREAKDALLSILRILKPSKKAIDHEYDAIGEVVDIYLKEQESYHRTI